MIDSVVLQLDKDDFKLLENHKLDGIKYQRNKGFSQKVLYCKEFVKKQKKEEHYFPSVSMPISKRGKQEVIENLEIQVSLPKLIYGTNALEIDFSDLEKILKNLEICLKQIGIETSKENLKRAVLKRVDFSKVIKLPDYFGTAKQVLRRLEKFDYKRSSDFSKRTYLNQSEGMALKFYNNTQSYTIYDKISELVGDGSTLFNQNILKALEENKLKKNVIKFEFAHQKKQSLEAFLRRRIKTKSHNFTLPDILQDKNIAKSILLKVFEEMYSPANQNLITLSEMGDNELLAYLKNQKMSFKTKSQLYYIAKMTTTFGIKGAFEELKSELKGGSYGRFKKEVALALLEVGEINKNSPNLLQYLRAKHEEFEIIKPKS
jgi:hypothetical protein